MNLKKYYLILLILSSHIFAGIGIGTLVKTPNSYTAIENLKINDIVETLDIKTKQIIPQKITSIRSHIEEQCLCIVLEDKQILVSLDQKFYLPEKRSWVYAKNLKIGDILLGQEKKQITNIFVINNKIELFNIEIENNHNFLITEYDILVHNNPVLILVPELIEFLPVVAETVVVAGTAVAVWLGLIHATDNHGKYDNIRVKYKGNYYLKVKTFNGNKYIDDELDKNTRKHIFLNKQGEKHGFIGGPNDQDPETWWEKIIKRIKKALECGEIVENGKKWEIREPQNINPNFGDLIIRGKIVDGIVEIGTAFLFDFMR